jgi:hypothetical protein
MTTQEILWHAITLAEVLPELGWMVDPSAAGLMTLMGMKRCLCNGRQSGIPNHTSQQI